MRFLGALFLIFIFSCTPSQEPTEQAEIIEYEIILEEQVSPTQSSIRGISVLNEKIAWLSGSKGAILRTANGGENWDLLPPPDEDSLGFRSIYAFDSITAVVASAGFPSRIYKTNDAGAQWKLVYENHDSAAFINSITFKNSTEGLAFGDQLNGRHLLLETKNAGDSWKLIDTALIPKPLLAENGFAASGSCIALDKRGSYFIGLGGEKSRVLSFINETWSFSESSLKAGSASSGIYSIASGDSLIMAVGGDYTQVDSAYFPTYSNDGGASWQKTNGKVSGYRSVIDYCEKEKIWITAGTNGIEYSIDKGANWIKFSDLDVNTLQFAPKSSSAYVANKEGKLFKMRASSKVKKD